MDVMEKQLCQTFACPLHVSLQAAGGAGVLRAAKSTSRTAGGAGEFQNAVLVVVTAAARHGAARHLSACRFTAKTSMIAWRAGVGGRAESEVVQGPNNQQVVDNVNCQCSRVTHHFYIPNRWTCLQVGTPSWDTPGGTGDCNRHHTPLSPLHRPRRSM